MRRRIELYIDGHLADISDQGLVLFNYATTDLTRPTVVRNSYSQQVTLPATPANAAIFGGYHRPDRVTTAEGFNALQRTPFTIYDEMSQVLADGYLRLDGVQRSGEVVTGYKVTLFGGIGAFFQALSYDDNGDEMSLADLDYLGTGSPDSELDFNISANAVNDAWNRLQEGNDGVIENMWDVINFAPCYEGIPDGEFDADKGYGTLTGMGLPAQTGYSADAQGGCRVNLSEKVDMWAAKDLRSYLQRPVVSVLAMMEAFGRRATAKGFTFDYSALDFNSYFLNMWKTLPLIPSQGSFNKASGNLTDTLQYTSGNTNPAGEWALSGLSTYTGVDIRATLGFTLLWRSNNSAAQMKMVDANYQWSSVVFLQLVAFDANDTIVGSSDVTMLGPDSCTMDAEQTARIVGFAPNGSPNYTYRGTKTVYASSGWQKVNGDIFMTIAATGIKKIQLWATPYRLYGSFNGTGLIVSKYATTGISPALWTTGGTRTDTTATTLAQSATPDVLTYAQTGNVRSGALITKQMLLGGKHTPADYLISLAKTFGWMFLYDEASRKMTVMRRDDFYGIDNTIDLSERIDRSRGIDIRPLNVESKWYEFALSMADGAFAKEYRETYGVDYGIQKVDTGYGFNADAINLLEGSALRAAVSKQAHGKYWYNLLYNSAYRPVMFLNQGCTYTLYDADGGEKNFDTPALVANIITMVSYSDTYAGYDMDYAYRLELADADGKAVNGEDVLVWYNDVKTMKYFKVSDDTSAMLAANNGRPCWNLNPGNSNGIKVPTFSRYKVYFGNYVFRSLDFGTPKEVDIPGITFQPYNLYSLWWQNYLTDLLDRDSKVMTCRVRLDGLQVNQALLRNFFWYEDSLWVLNKIRNYSLTTFDTAECEFVQVRNKTNYTNGQD